jgi:D-glycero-alpha-D-manno-heptose-7-phosphate kinase
VIISKTPLRISLFGGSTDVPEFFSEHESLLLGFALNQYVYLLCRYTPRIQHYRTSLQYSKTEQVDDNILIQHDGCRGTLQHLDIQDGLEIVNLIDLPARTGLGSSSSYVVGLLNALNQLLHCKPARKLHLAQDSIHIERKLLNEAGGLQDQIWAAYGGVNSIHIDKQGDFKVRPLPVCKEFLNLFNQSMVLFYTGEQRNSFKIAASHNTEDALPFKKQIKQIAEEALKAFAAEDIDKIGTLLDESWNQKRQTSPLISTPQIDELYKHVKRHGAIGAKLLGSGQSGFLLCITNDRHKLIRNMDLQHVEFTFDHEGSKILLS